MNYEETAGKVLDYVGGKDNVSGVTYCMTRLRITPKDRGLVRDEEIKAMPGILGTRMVGAQYQIIIGQDVEFVYKAFCKQGGFAETTRIDENIKEDKPKEKLTAKKVLDNIMDAVAGCVTPLIPIITAAGLLKLIVAVVGPTMLGLLPETSNFIRLLTFVSDAGFYFFPMYVAYGGAKKFGANIPLSLFLAGVLLHPTLFEIVGAGEVFSVYGIPMKLTTYSANFISMLLITWVMSYVEKGLNKIIPKSLRILLFPVSLVLIMLPIALCVLGPLGSIIGEGIAKGITALYGFAGPLAVAVVGALWPLLIATGMHQALIAIAVTQIASQGFDASILVGATVANYAMIAIGLAYLIQAKTADKRAYASSSFITLALGGISEPTLFGIILRNRKAILWMMAGGFAGGLYAGIMKVAVYFLGTTNVLACLCTAGERAGSLLQGVISCIVSFAVTFVLCMVFKIEDKEKRKAVSVK